MSAKTLLVFVLVASVMSASLAVDYGPHNHKPHDIRHIAETHLKDIPSAEISKHILLADKKNKIAKLEKTVDVPLIEIKQLENAIKIEPVNSKLALTPQQIERQILDLITDHKEANKVIKPVNKCQKPKIGKRKGRKLLRSLKKGRKQRTRPRKLRVLKGRLRADVNGGRGRGRDRDRGRSRGRGGDRGRSRGRGRGRDRGRGRGRGNKAGRSKKYVTKGKKGKVGTTVTVRIGNNVPAPVFC